MRDDLATIKHALIARLRELLSQKKDSASATLLAYPDQQLLSLVFHNHGYAQGGSLRLTKEGLKTLQAHFRSYTIELAEDQVFTVSHLLFFYQHSNLPYFISDKRLVLFDGLLAAKINLMGGCLNGVLDMQGFDRTVRRD